MSRAGFARLSRVAAAALELALKRGASAAAVRVRRAWSRSLESRDGILERFEESVSNTLTLRLFANGRYGVFQSSDLRPAELQRFVERAFDVVGALAADPLRALPDPALYRGRSRRPLALIDPEPPPDVRTLATTLARIEEGARAVAGDASVTSISAGGSFERSRSLLLHSDGYSGAREATSAGRWCVVTLLDDGERRPLDRFVDRARCASLLTSPDQAGRLAMQRARARMGALPAPTGVVPVVVEARAAARLIDALLEALKGANLVQRRSFLTDRLGQRVASRAFTLVDDPLVAGGLGSRRFDGEGLAARRRVLVRRGVLQGLLLDTYYARKLNAAPTAGSSSNAVVGPGTRDLAGLLAAAGQGVLVTGFLGGNVNAATGDFSLGVIGSLIRDGQAGPAIAGSNLSGNLLELFGNLVEAGSDTLTSSAFRVPSLRFEGVQVSGR